MKLKIRKWISEKRWYILAFAIPFVVVLTAFICQGLWPFGDRGIAIIDSYHQYVPFFSELQYKWRHFDSLFYSWNGGLGMNFWAVIAYYLASPLNLLLLVFPKSMVMECFTFIYLIKIGLAGLSFSVFLKKRFDHYGPSVTVFGCCYAMSSFIIGYGWNIMWLDCLLLFPMVMLGIHQLVRQNRGWMYGISLGLCIFTNYYISIMICLFLCFYVLVEINGSREIWLGEKVRRFGRFVVYSLLGGGLGGVMLVPTAYALMASQSADSTFPKTLKFYHDVFELLCQHFTAIEPTSLSGNFNLYCGAAMLLLVPLYLLNSRTRLGDKVLHILLTAFLLVSLNTNMLTYVWHGFHFPNGLPGRFSFIYIFLVLSMGYEGWRNRRYAPKWTAAVSAAAWLAFLGYCWWGQKAELETYTWGVTIGVILIYAVLLTAARLVQKKRRIVELLLMFVILIEACGYGTFGLCMNGTVNRKDYYSDQTAVRTLKNEVAAREKEAFYRMEVEERRGRDDVTWHNLPGMSLFSSTANAGVDHLARRLGFYAVTNKYSYQGATPETDAFLDIAYLISGKKQETIRTFEWMSENAGENLYVNHCALGPGFMVSENIREWDYEKTNPFDVINQIILSATGEDMHPYDYFGLPEPTAEGCELTTDSWADWSYTSGDSKEGMVTYTYTPETSMDLYIYFKATHCEKVEVTGPSGKRNYSDEDGHIIEVGDVNSGETVTFVFYLDDEYDKGSIKLIAAQHDIQAFYRMFDTLKRASWKIDAAASTELKGSIRAEADGIMFTSIPFDEGWSVRVDGEKAEVEKIADAFIGIELTEGEHYIEMHYRPKGFVFGLLLTGISAALLWVMYRKERRASHDNVYPQGTSHVNAPHDNVYPQGTPYVNAPHGRAPHDNV